MARFPYGGARERSIRADRAGLSPRLSADGLVSTPESRPTTNGPISTGRSPLVRVGGQDGLPVARVESEVGSGMNGARAKVRRLLTDRR